MKRSLTWNFLALFLLFCSASKAQQARQTVFETADLPKGLYFIKAEGNSGKRSQKIIIQ